MQPAALQRGEREVAARHVAGLYKLNAIDLALSREEEVGLHESAWFQPLSQKKNERTDFRKMLFQMQLVPPRYALGRHPR